MRNWWLKFGCFLTGYNYKILATCSEGAAKTVKKYTSALVIVCIIWAFVGFMFTSRYLQSSLIGSIAGAVLAVIIIVQVERQIILNLHRNYGLYIFRGIIALVMAFLGALIIDQIIFKNDIELEQIAIIDQKVNTILPLKTKELSTQISSLDSTISLKEFERQQLMTDITKNPTIQSVTSSTVPVTVNNSVTDSLKNTRTTARIVHTNTKTVTTIANPKMELIQPLDKQIELLRNRKATLDSNLLALRPVVEKEIKSKVGFLDELKVMYNLITGSAIAAIVYGLWFLLLLGLEMFVLISKTTDKQNDYDEKVLSSMQIHLKKLHALNGKTPVSP